MQSIEPNYPALTWAGAISVQHTEQWSMPWRIPHDELALFPPAEFQARAAMSAGVRIVFQSDTQTIAGKIVPMEEMAPLDIRCDGEYIATIPLDNTEQFHVADLPAGEKQIELWLPQFGEFRLRELQIDDDATLAQSRDERPHWITYGSSITQCRTASSPTQTWPALVANALDLNLTCLGYGGQCHLDPMIAHMICGQSVDFLSICVGINIYGAASLGPRAFRPAIIGFIQTVRTAHPEIPIAVLSPIYSPPRETTPNAVGFTLQQMRTEVEAAVAALHESGDPDLHYVNGLEIFSEAEAHLLPDELHPNAEGYRRMGANFTERVGKVYFR